MSEPKIPNKRAWVAPALTKTGISDAARPRRLSNSKEIGGRRPPEAQPYYPIITAKYSQGSDSVRNADPAPEKNASGGDSLNPSSHYN